MKTLRNYWEDQLGLYQKKLRMSDPSLFVFLMGDSDLEIENGDTAGCQAVLKAVREEMAKEENQELFEDESKPPSVDMGMELEFPPPPQSGPPPPFLSPQPEAQFTFLHSVPKSRPSPFCFVAPMTPSVSS